MRFKLIKCYIIYPFNECFERSHYNDFNQYNIEHKKNYLPIRIILLPGGTSDKFVDNS